MGQEYILIFYMKDIYFNNDNFAINLRKYLLIINPSSAIYWR